MTDTSVERNDVTTTGSSGAAEHESDQLLRPAVDIFEDAGGITLVADLPGVSRERLNLEVDKDMLLIEGDASVETPAHMEALHADVRQTRYRRSFALSSELDTGEIVASLKDGVLNLRIPRRAEVRPRKINVRVD